MLRQGINQISDAKWSHGVEGDDKWFYSLRVYHIIETVEFYSRNTHEGMLWGKRLGKVNWWDEVTHEEAANRVTKKLVVKYLNDLEQHLLQLFQEFSDEDLLSQDGFHWFASLLEKFLYALRHSSYHIGELTMHLRSQGGERIHWS